jgi:hypothetical protein
MSNEDDETQDETVEPWRPELAPPVRAANIPTDAEWDNDNWRWKSGPDGGSQRFFAMTGVLLQEREVVDGELRVTSYYPDAKIAAKQTKKDGNTHHESFYADGKPWCVADYINDTESMVSAEQVASEKLWAHDGTIIRATSRKDGAFRESIGETLRFENLPTPEGRELRFYDKDGKLEVTLKAKKAAAKALAILGANREVMIDGADIDENTQRSPLEQELGFRIFAETINDEPTSPALDKFIAKNAWSKKIDKDAPFENASVANFLKALGSTLPHVAEMGIIGLTNLITEEKHVKAVTPYLKSLGTSHADRALKAVGDEDDEEEADEEAKTHDGEHTIGKVTLPSGMLVLTDMGALGQWSHEAPHHADIAGSAWAKYAQKEHDDYVDLVVTGPDAAKAFAKFVSEHGADDLFDVDRDHLEHTKEHFKEHCEGLDANIEISKDRIGHGQRLRMLRDAGLPFAELSFAHVNVIAVFGLPKTGELPVVGMHDDEGSWAYVSLVVKPTKAVRETELERLSIEEARFIFADGEALKAWDHDRSIDGLRDFVFWGGAEDDIAAATGAVRAYQDADYLGWADLPPGALPPHIAHRVLSQVEAGGLVAELRPHSTHHMILSQAWRSPDEAGTAEIGGAKMTGLFSSVGDGVFPVFAEYDESGELCRVTVKITAAQDEEEDDEDDDDDDDDDDEDEDDEDDE